MSLTKAVNSKANTKSASSADLPTSLAQPVIARYSATSTTSQSSITLTFLVDQANTDAFMLYVDGKLLTLGSGNDYVFAAIDQNNSSSQITLNQTLPAGLNILAYKLGLKKESEFAMDNRFVNVYESLGKSFQPFVDQSSVLTAVNGTPSATQFLSTITNRASIPNLSNNLKAYMGIDRVEVQQLVQLQNEFGPNGEPVFSVVNDDKGLIRFVGGWSSLLNNYGAFAQAVLTTNITDYVEITFFGTGLNALVFNVPYDARASVDGGTEGANIFAGASAAGILGSRNYPANQVVNVASGLTLGVHTVKIRTNSSNPVYYGFETLNESSSLKITPGVSYSSGGKTISSVLSNQAYNSTFETGTLGTKGGRVLVYQKSDGTIAKAVTPVNAAQANLTSSDHTSEEIARVYNLREFGAGRADDFSTGAGTISRAFTLDDGITTVSGQGITVDTSNLVYVNTAGNFILITFVGTGLDIFSNNNGAVDGQYNIAVDGVQIATNATGAALLNLRNIKIVSGLPYGTHTVKFTATNLASVAVFAFGKLIVYQPKKPTLPSGAIELADYNVMATYVANTAGTDFAVVSTGTIRKSVTREFSYTGTPTINLNTPNFNTGWCIDTAVGGTASYQLFGTGFDLHLFCGPTASNSVAITINGLAANTTNFPTLVVTPFGGVTNSAGTLNTNGASSNSYAAGVSFSGLPIGSYKVLMTNNATNSSPLELYSLDIITPIHSAKSNTAFDVQNTLPVGSQGISDNRKFSAVKDAISQIKNISQAFGISSNPTTTSTVFVPTPDMSVIHTNNSGRIKISYSIAVAINAVGTLGLLIYVDGAYIGTEKDVSIPTAAYDATVSDFLVTYVSPGFHKIDLYWKTNNGTLSALNNNRNLLVEEV